MREQPLAALARRATLVLLGLVWLAPVYLLLVNASRPAAGYDAERLWLPHSDFGFADNLRTAWDRVDLGQSILSSVIYSALSPALAVLVGAAAGFAIVVLRLRAGFWWFMFIFGGTVFPFQMLIIPLFLGYSRAGLYDSRTGLVLAYTVILVPFAAFVMRNFFTGIAYTIFEAARVDGASIWRIFWRLYLPMSLPALSAIFILECTLIWNDLLIGLTLSQSSEVRPIMTAVAALQSAYGGSTVPVVLASGVVVSLPMVVLFLATQRLFAKGLSLGQY